MTPPGSERGKMQRYLVFLNSWSPVLFEEPTTVLLQMDIYHLKTNKQRENNKETFRGHQENTTNETFLFHKGTHG